MNVAIFIDYENVYFGLINQYNFKPQVAHLVSLILNKVGQDGNLLIKKAYADWERPEFHGAQAALKKSGIEPAFALSKKTVRQAVSVWKDTADAALMLDAQQTVYERSDIGEFVLVTGDRAFLDLIHRLSSQGKKVKICALQTAVAQELSDAVGIQNVISIEGLLGIEPAAPPKLSSVFVVDGKIDWTLVIRKFYELESRLPFVALKLARDRHGFSQEIINDGMAVGIFKTHTVPKAGQQFPTTALRLDPSSEIVKVALKDFARLVESKS